MTRQQALREADLWRIDARTQVSGQAFIKEHESISKAKAFSRKQGRCVVLRKEERGHGEQEYGFFRFGEPS